MHEKGYYRDDANTAKLSDCFIKVWNFLQKAVC